MNIFFRILLTIYAFCLTIISAVTIVITFKTDLFDAFYKYMKESILPNGYASAGVMTIAFVFCLLSLMFLFSGVKKDKKKRAVSKQTSLGEICISLNTVENIALSASRRLTGVRDTKAIVTKLEDSVSIIVKAIVMIDTNIPALSEDMQTKVKKSVEESSGIKVRDVKVIVENIHTGYKSRVE